MMIFYKVVGGNWMFLMLLQFVSILDEFRLLNLDVIDLGAIESPGSQE